MARKSNKNSKKKKLLLIVGGTILVGGLVTAYALSKKKSREEKVTENKDADFSPAPPEVEYTPPAPPTIFDEGPASVFDSSNGNSTITFNEGSSPYVMNIGSKNSFVA